MADKSDLRHLPSIDTMLHSHTAAELIALYGRPLTLEAIRYVLSGIRQDYRQRGATIPSPDKVLQRAGRVLNEWTAPTLQPVINATGVILHTNLGRAPLSESAITAMQAVSQGYSTLEYDIHLGKRGSRYTHTEDLLKRLTGAESALVVNNNASALLLILSALARRRRVLISRTQLIEIGGGFRIPEVMKQSGTILVEIGTTNRVHLSDYQEAVDEQPIKMVMRAHRSNFQLVGFTSEPTLEEIADVAHGAGLLMVDDLGSGTLIDTTRFGLEHEPTIQESLAAGADLVCFSGDKLLGGPQGGIIVGRADLIAKLRKHPMARAIRADKLALSGLSATLLHYLKDEAEREIPIWQMISTTTDMIKSRAENWATTLEQGEVILGESAVGGGSLPGGRLPTYLFALKVKSAGGFMAALREEHPPIIARVDEDKIVFETRTVMPKQEGAFLVGLQNVLSAF
ncbi:MAG: L-seryl-tRNA(Sec) selenium transferase [Anaerolineales bacterium]|nr:L-seryl-tRNA(Sec) selenium transferase [Anaerolineales bacterium]